MFAISERAEAVSTMFPRPRPIDPIERLRTEVHVSLLVPRSQCPLTPQFRRHERDMLRALTRQIAPQFFTWDLPATLAYHSEKLVFDCVGTSQDPPAGCAG